jgi:hypothetical protein
MTTSIQSNWQQPSSPILDEAVKIKKPSSLYGSPKPIVMLTAALAISATVAVILTKIFPITKNGCVERFYDQWTDKYCRDGKFVYSLNECAQLPEAFLHRGFQDLIDYCEANKSDNGNQLLTGCLDGKFYRELTQECMDNPSAALCDGNYDYEKDFRDHVFRWVQPEGFYISKCNSMK